MPALARATILIPVATITVIALLALVVDLREQREQAHSAALDIVSALFGGESGRALLEHPLSVSAWRVGVPGARVAVADAAAVHALVALLEEPASYQHDLRGLAAHGAVAVRFESEQGSLTVAVAEDGRWLEVSRDGSRISQAALGPAQERLATVLRKILAGGTQSPRP
jgi:hypothetical protein